MRQVSLSRSLPLSVYLFPSSSLSLPLPLCLSLSLSRSLFLPLPLSFTQTLSQDSLSDTQGGRLVRKRLDEGGRFADVYHIFFSHFLSQTHTHTLTRIEIFPSVSLLFSFSHSQLLSFSHSHSRSLFLSTKLGRAGARSRLGEDGRVLPLYLSLSLSACLSVPLPPARFLSLSLCHDSIRHAWRGADEGDLASVREVHEYYHYY